MPRFHFEIVDGYRLEDPYGMELPTEHQAKAVAEQIAGQTALDLEDSSLETVVVKTEAGVEVYTTHIRKRR